MKKNTTSTSESDTLSTARYCSMKYNRCGRSGLKLPIISLGCWQNFGDVSDLREAKKILLRSFDLGITHFDLANNYGPPPGTAEENVGKFLKSDLKAYRDEIIVSSKAGYLMWPGPYGEWGSKKNFMASLDQSLKRLRLDYVDIFYIHRFDPETPLEETVGALDLAIRQGKTLYGGISNFYVEEAMKACEIASRLGHPILVNQMRYHMFDRKIENGLIELAGKLGFGLTIFSALAQGLLSNKYLNGIPKDSRAATGKLAPSREGLNKNLTPARLIKLKHLNEVAQNRGQPLARMALSWILRHPEVTSIITGASRVSQMEDNVAVLKDPPLSTEEISLIEKILSAEAA